MQAAAELDGRDEASNSHLSGCKQLPAEQGGGIAATDWCGMHAAPGANLPDARNRLAWDAGGRRA